MNNDNNKVGFFQVMGSVIAAMFGVQKEKNRERDFTSGKLWHYILGGILFTIVFIAILILIVKTALGDL